MTDSQKRRNDFRRIVEREERLMYDCQRKAIGLRTRRPRLVILEVAPD